MRRRTVVKVAAALGGLRALSLSGCLELCPHESLPVRRGARPHYDAFGDICTIFGSLHGKRQYFTGVWCRKLQSHRSRCGDLRVCAGRSTLSRYLRIFVKSGCTPSRSDARAAGQALLALLPSLEELDLNHCSQCHPVQVPCFPASLHAPLLSLWAIYVQRPAENDSCDVNGFPGLVGAHRAGNPGRTCVAQPPHPVAMLPC